MFIRRDSFARMELHGTAHKAAHGEDCRYCGNVNSKGQLFEYRNESDGGRKYDISGAFCGVRCMRAYHCN